MILFAMIVRTSGEHVIQSSITGNAGHHEVSWNSLVGYNYLVEASPDLQNWEDTGHVEAGTGAIVTCEFSTPEEAKRFYRARIRPGAVRPGFDEYVLAANDDGSTGLVPLGFSINLFGTTWSQCFVNNNGNITFQGPRSSYTPFPLRDLGEPVIAPFWADVDTRASGSNSVVYSHGIETIDGRSAFGVSWRNVGYYSEYDDKLNSFQLILIDRSDTGIGDFDIEFNFDIILWETGDASAGVDGYGGYPSRSGLSSGGDQTMELRFSGQSLTQLDGNPVTGLPNFLSGLIYRHRNSNTPGRFVFQSRAGQMQGALIVDAGPDQSPKPDEISVDLEGEASDPGGGDVTVQWSVLNGASEVTFSNPAILNPTVSIPLGSVDIVLELTATSVGDSSIVAADSMTISR